MNDAARARRRLKTLQRRADYLAEWIARGEQNDFNSAEWEALKWAIRKLTPPQGQEETGQNDRLQAD